MNFKVLDEGRAEFGTVPAATGRVFEKYCIAHLLECLSYRKNEGFRTVSLRIRKED